VNVLKCILVQKGGFLKYIVSRYMPGATENTHENRIIMIVAQKSHVLTQDH